MSWIYCHKEFTDEDIPEGAVGFIYLMAIITEDGVRSYIGKKNFHATIKKKIGKKALPTDKRLKKYTRISKSSYQNYYSSNEVLKKAHKDGILIHRSILKICFSRRELTYEEVKAQFEHKVLETNTYLNGNIMGRWFKKT